MSKILKTPSETNISPCMRSKRFPHNSIRMYLFEAQIALHKNNCLTPKSWSSPPSTAIFATVDPVNPFSKYFSASATNIPSVNSELLL